MLPSKHYLLQQSVSFHLHDIGLSLGDNDGFRLLSQPQLFGLSYQTTATSLDISATEPGPSAVRVDVAQSGCRQVHGNSNFVPGGGTSSSRSSISGSSSSSSRSAEAAVVVVVVVVVVAVIAGAALAVI